jgi:hypothetical protein
VPLAHAPPAGVQVSVLVIPIQPFIEPAMADGDTLIVIALVLLQLPDMVYDITAVPAATPVTIPVPLTEAVAVLDEDHEPPVVAHARVIVALTQALPPPVMAAGIAYTLTTAVT